MAYRQMVALGSSFAAGPGIRPVANRAALRSQRNYAHLVATQLGATLIDATVSGATTATILSDSQRMLGVTFAPQIESVHPDTDLVTITAAGNDLNYLPSMVRSATAHRLSRHRLTVGLSHRLGQGAPLVPITSEQKASATDGLTRIVEQVRTRALRARVVLVDYLPVVTAHTTPGPNVPLDAEAIDHFRGLATELSACFEEASRRTGADLVAASSLPQNHGLGSDQPWVFGLHLTTLMCPFHPTAEGMRAVADRVVAQIEAPN